MKIEVQIEDNRFNVEYCDPFDNKNNNLLMKLEHCGRYLWATDCLSKVGSNRVLDVACATGYGTKMLAEKLEDVIGVDKNMECLDYARKCNNGSNIEYRCVDLEKESVRKYVSDSFDAVVCFETLEHLIEPEKLLKDIYKLLVNEGCLLVSVPNSIYERIDEDGNNLDSYHKHVFSKDRMISLLNDNGFDVCEILGQDITNRIVSRIVDSDYQDELEVSGDIRKISYLMAYPDDSCVDRSYSYIFCCKKRNL